MNKSLSVKNYIAIADWMLDLNLNTRELLTYALIYGFCQDGQGYYYGSYTYLANWLGIESSQNVIRYLKPLVDKKLLIKKQGTSKLNQKLCLYQTSSNKGPIIDNPDVDYLIIQPWMLHSMHLNGKDLLLYALVHGYSRKQSENVCKYKRDYFAKWLHCQKNNVKRQVDRAIENGLIKKVDKDSYVAIVPDDIKIFNYENKMELDDIDLNDVDNTFSNKKSQTESTSKNKSLKLRVPRSQTESTSSLKVRDNNLLDNLEDNLILNNNNTNQNKTNIYRSKEELSVVVNKDFDIDSLSCFKQEKDFFTFKQELDFSIYTKYQKRTLFDIVLFLQKSSSDFYRLAFVLWQENQVNTINKVSELIIKTLTSSRFVKDVFLLNNLTKKECFTFISQAFDLYDDEKCPIIHKSKQAYLIGVLKNIIGDKIR